MIIHPLIPIITKALVIGSRLCFAESEICPALNRANARIRAEADDTVVCFAGRSSAQSPIIFEVLRPLNR